MRRNLFTNSSCGGLAAAAGSLLLGLCLWEIPVQGQQQSQQGGASRQTGPGPGQGMRAPSQGMSGQQMQAPRQEAPRSGSGMRDTGRSGMDQGDLRRPGSPQTFDRQMDRSRQAPSQRDFPQQRQALRPESIDQQRDRFLDRQRDLDRDQRGRDDRTDRSSETRDRARQEDFDRRQDSDRRQDFDRREETERRDTRQDDRRTGTRIRSAIDLGISISLSDRDRLLIRDVHRNSFAARAGLRRGDIILAIDHRRVSTVRDFDAFVARIDFVERVPILVLRDGREQTIYLSPDASYGQYDSDYQSEYVEVLDNYFKPAVLRIRPGTTVSWTNYGHHSHTVTADNHSWDSGELHPGESWSATFNRPRTHYYYCRYHTRDRMEGVIIVGDGGSGTYEQGARSY
jgi:plastocyanin